MNIAVTDDLPKEREKIIRILSEYAASNHMEISVSEYDSAEGLLTDYRLPLYSAVFLDIYMDGMSGNKAAQRIRETDKDAIIIFLTTSEDHMPDAFRLHAYEYIVKPIRKEDLFPVMDDILKKTTPVKSPLFSFLGLRSPNVSSAKLKTSFSWQYTSSKNLSWYLQSYLGQENILP